MSVFEFVDYKAFLRSKIKSLPKGGRGEFTRLANHLNINSTMISQIMSGSKDFSLEQAKKVAEYFVLPTLETDYFMILVQIERAGTQDLKNYYREKRNTIKNESMELAKRIPHERKLTDLERSIFYSSFLYSAIHLFCSVDSGKSLESIIERFDIPRARAQEVMQFLTSTGLCIQERNIYKMGSQSTHIESGSPFLIKHHSNWRIAAIQKSESLSKEEMMFTANISLSKKDFGKIREALAQTIQEISKTVQDSPAEEIANINIDFFWIDT